MKLRNLTQKERKLGRNIYIGAAILWLISLFVFDFPRNVFIGICCFVIPIFVYLIYLTFKGVKTTT